jgi:glycerol-3-phosphate acyltransferase PlsY
MFWTILIWTGLAFLSGAVPYSLLLGRFGGQVDVRQYGDHNPGAANVLRALGWRWAAPAMLLDGLKATVPVGLAWFFYGVSGWAILPVALAPLLGHAYSPFLSGRGGKAMAATFGVWAGLTLGAGPTVLGLLLGLMSVLFAASGWAVVASFSLFGIFIYTYYFPGAPVLMAIWLLNGMLLAWKYRSDLDALPRLRAWRLPGGSTRTGQAGQSGENQPPVGR